MLKLIRRYLSKRCLWRLLWPYYCIAVGLALIGYVSTLISTMLLLSLSSLYMSFFSWLFYIWFLMNLMDKIVFGRDTCLMDENNFGILISLTIFYSILSLWGLLNILFYQVLREYGMKMLFTPYSMLFTATLTSTSIIFALGSWVISRRDREDEGHIAVVKVTMSLLLVVFIGVFVSLLLTADLLVMRQIFLVTLFLAISLGLIITMAQTLVLMHALMDMLSELTKPEGETKGPEHKVEGVKEGTGDASKSQS